MKRLVAAALAVGGAFILTPRAGATPPPTPEKTAQVQAWMGEQLLTVPGATTRAGVFLLVNLDARTVLLAAEEHNDKAQKKAENKGSENIDAYRSVITHSPDKKLNKAINKALDALGAWYDGTSDQRRFDKATDKPWAQVKTRLASYGIPADGWILG